MLPGIENWVKSPSADKLGESARYICFLAIRHGNCDDRPRRCVRSERPQDRTRVGYVFENLRTDEKIKWTQFGYLIQAGQNGDAGLHCHVHRFITEWLDIAPAKQPQNGAMAAPVIEHPQRTARSSTKG